MKLTKFEIEGTQEEVTQFLKASVDIEGLNFSVDDTCQFFRDNFLNNAAKEIEKKKAEKQVTDKTAINEFNSKVAELGSHIFNEFKNKEFTVIEILDLADKVISYANKKSCPEQTK